MRIACLCPTFGQAPQPLANAAACFLAQDYPGESRQLYVLDDSNQLTADERYNIQVASVKLRFPSLPHKYHAIVTWVNSDWSPDAYAVWDSDDVYLPHHLRSAVESLRGQRCAFWKAGRVFSLYTGQLATEDAAGRFHGSLVVSREALKVVGGWLRVMPGGPQRLATETMPGDRRADFDQRMLRALDNASRNTWCEQPPTYVYRWASSHSQHCSGLMRSPDDETWYTRHGRRVHDQQLPRVGRLVPEFDAETLRLYQHCGFLETHA